MKWDRKHYDIWRMMIRRCYDSSRPEYPRYGARGIEVCKRWRDSYQAFIEDMGYRPSSTHSIDRIDNNGNYHPKNCKWSTAVEQQANTRKSVFVTAFGQTMNVASWARKTGLSPHRIYQRLKSGWPDDKAVSELSRRRV